MRRVYADRAEYMGDPDFVDVRATELMSKDYAASLRSGIDTARATSSDNVHHGLGRGREHDETTHYSVADSFGNCVSVTYTLNDLFGSQVVVRGAGFFLNNEMDDFSARPGVPNSYGLVGGFANQIEGGKRPLSSMAPTILLKDGRPVMILGARGGSRIITAVFQTILNVIDYGMNMQDAVNAARFHNQWLPDELIFEKSCFQPDVALALKRKGHLLKEVSSSMGELETIFIDQANGWLYGAPDPREGGTASGY
jgi:gamma-glutamyltranspeptidase / glutathione hydrolase